MECTGNSYSKIMNRTKIKLEAYEDIPKSRGNRKSFYENGLLVLWNPTFDDNSSKKT